MFDHPPDLSSDIDWLLQSGQSSWVDLAETLVDAWYPLLYQFSFSLLDDDEEARQVVIDTFVSALLGTHYYSSELGVQNWLLRYAIQIINSKFKKDGEKLTFPRFLRFSPNHPGRRVNSSKVVTEPEKMEYKIAWQVLNSSPIEDRLPGLLYFQFDLSVEDIAEILKCEDHSVHFHLQKCRSHLRRALETSGLGNATIKTGYLERLMRRTCQQYRSDIHLKGNQRNTILQEIIRLSSRKHHLRKTHISFQEFGTISLVVLVIASISWGVSFLLPISATRTQNHSTGVPAITQPAAIAIPIRSDNKGQEISEFPLKSVVHYIVLPGDTLEIVSERLGVSPTDLQTLNNLPEDGALLIGQILIFRPPTIPIAEFSSVIEIIQPPEALGAHSSPSSIRARIQEYDQYVQSLWAEGQVIFYGPAGYSGPPRSYRLQVWSMPGSVFVVTGPSLGSPEGTLLSTSAPEFSSPGNFLALRSGDTSQWFFTDGEHLAHHSMLDFHDFPIEALQLVQKMFDYQLQRTLIAPVRVETVSGRKALVTDIVTSDDEERGRLWVDQNNGAILRWQHFTGLQENIVDWEVTLTNVVFDKVIHPYFFKPFYYLPEQFAQDLSGYPESLEVEGKTSGRLLSFTHPELSFPPAPRNFDPGDQWLVFQYPNSFDYHALSADVEIFSNQYYLGSLPFGNPWTIICSRAPDGYKIAYVDRLDRVSKETFLKWFDLRDGDFKVHHVLGGMAIQELAFSPDSRYLAAYGNYGGDGSIYLVDLLTQRIRMLKQLNGAYSLAWSPDGRSLAMISQAEAANNAATLFVIDVDNGQVIHRSLWNSQNSEAQEESPVTEWGIHFPVQPQGLEGCARPPEGNE
jgi:RNA polymerase sigma-70 factor, ECF subfamily